MAYSFFKTPLKIFASHIKELYVIVDFSRKDIGLSCLDDTQISCTVGCL